MNPSFLKGIMYTLFSSLCIALMGVVVKAGSAAVSDSMLLFFRTLIPFLALLFFIANVNLKQIKHDFKTHFIRASFATAGQFAYIACINQTSVFEATLLYYTGPLFIPILAKIFYKKPLTFKMALSLAIGFIGVVLVVHPSAGQFNMAIVLGLLSGFAMAVSQLCNYSLTNDSSYINNVFAMYGLSSLLCLIPLVLSLFLGTALTGSAATAGAGLSWFVIVIVFILPGLLSLGNQAFRDLSYRQVTHPGLLSPFMFSAVLFSALLGLIFYGEIPGIMTWAGMVLIILGSLLILLVRDEHNKNITVKAR